MSVLLVLHALVISLFTKLVSERAEPLLMDPLLQVWHFQLVSWVPSQTTTHTAERLLLSSVLQLAKPLKQLLSISAWVVKVTLSISPTSHSINWQKNLLAVLKPLGTSTTKSLISSSTFAFDILVIYYLEYQVKIILILLDIHIASSIYKRVDLFHLRLAYDYFLKKIVDESPWGISWSYIRWLGLLVG